MFELNQLKIGANFRYINSLTRSDEVRVEPRAISKIYHWDGQTVLDCFELDTAYNTRYAVKYPFFAQFLTPIGAQNPSIY
jgi:hypothetical protein